MGQKQSLDHYIFEEEVSAFFLKHAAKLINVHPRTLRRWIEVGKARSWKSKINSYVYLDLTEINRLRDDRKELTSAEAIEILKQKYEAEDDRN